MEKHSHNKKGFTLVEILVAVAIATVVGLAIASFGARIFSYNRTTQNALTAADHARKILHPMSDNIRSAVYGQNGAYPIESATDTSIVFYTDYDHDSIAEKVRYFIEDGKIKVGVIEPTINPVVYDDDDEVVINLMDGVISTSLFSYYDENFTGTSEALAFPVNVADIRLIGIDIVLDIDPYSSPNSYSIGTRVTIRTIKDNT
ncbi:MAG: type II secretion system protein [Candidatus Pacebacteria bacterium]|nr:type II secretion system protein [Candidatus Paceibacterota bacterium]